MSLEKKALFHYKVSSGPSGLVLDLVCAIQTSREVRSGDATGPNHYGWARTLSSMFQTPCQEGSEGATSPHVPRNAPS